MKDSSIINKTIFFCLLFIISAAAIIFILYSRPYLRALNLNSMMTPDLDLVLYINPSKFSVISYINRYLSSEDVILSFRQVDNLYYGKNRIYRDLDPALTNFYEINDKMVAYKYLLDLGISYIYCPFYQLPTYTNSQFSSIIADQSLCTLVYENGGVYLYKLHKNITFANTNDIVNITPSHGDCSINNLDITTCNMSFSENPTCNTMPFAGNYVYKGKFLDSIFEPIGHSLEFSVYTGHGGIELPDTSLGLLKPSTDYSFSIETRGAGNIKAYIVIYSPATNFDNTKKTYQLIPIWNSVLYDQSSPMRGQFKTPKINNKNGCFPFRLLFVCEESGKLQLQTIKIIELIKGNASEQITRQTSQELFIDNTQNTISAFKENHSKTFTNFDFSKSPGSSLHTGFGDLHLSPTNYPLLEDNIDFSNKLVKLSFAAHGTGSVSFMIYFYFDKLLTGTAIVDNIVLTDRPSLYSYDLQIPSEVTSYRLVFCNIQNKPYFYLYNFLLNNYIGYLSNRTSGCLSIDDLVVTYN